MQGAPLLPPAVTHLILTTTTVFESLIHLLTVNVHRTSLPLLSWQQLIRLQNLPAFVFTCQVAQPHALHVKTSALTTGLF